MVGLQRLLVGRPSAVDARVERRVVQQQRRLDLGGIRGRRLCAIEGNRRGQIRAHPHRQRVGDAAAEAEADHADLAGAVGPRLQPARRRHEILGHLGASTLPNSCRAFLVVARIAADAGQPVGRERDEIRRAQAPRHILDIRIQAAILVHHQHAGQLSRWRSRAAPDSP